MTRGARRQVDDKVLVFESALAVKDVMGANAHIHANVKFFNGNDLLKPAMEIDSVFRVGREDCQNSQT